VLELVLVELVLVELVLVELVLVELVLVELVLVELVLVELVLVELVLVELVLVELELVELELVELVRLYGDVIVEVDASLTDCDVSIKVNDCSDVISINVVSVRVPLIIDGIEGEVIDFVNIAVVASVVSTDDTSDMYLLLICDVSACEVDDNDDVGDDKIVVFVVSVVVKVEV
jgi:hypothetical protein